MKEYELYTGAYTGSKEEAGVRSWRFDGRALREAGRFCGLENPSYVLPWEDRLYVVDGNVIESYSLEDYEKLDGLIL